MNEVSKLLLILPALDQTQQSVRKFTGGDVVIDTGDADVDVDVDTMANFNWADIADCCLIDGKVKIAGNGYESDNDLGLALTSVLAANQTNDYDCKGKKYSEYEYWWNKKSNCNDVDVDADTGNNDANGNTHFDGDPSIYTGDASSSVSVSTSANANGLTVGGDTLDEFEVEFPEGFPFGDFNGFLGWWLAFWSA